MMSSYSDRPTFTGNTIASGFDAIVRLLLILIATPLLIDNLGPSRFGAFAFLSMISAYGVVYFLELGVEGALTTLVARCDAQSPWA